MYNIAEQLKLFTPEMLSKPKRGTPETDLIAQFVKEINADRPEGSFYIKNGKKVKLAKTSFVAVLKKLKTKNWDKNYAQMSWLMKECYRSRQVGKMEHNFQKTFSSRFFGEFLDHEWQRPP